MEDVETVSQVDEAPAVNGAAGEANETSLNVNDILNAVKIIDFAAEQGAFKGWSTIEQVLIVRNRLNGFLSSAGVSADDSGENGEETTTTPPTQQ